MGTKRLLLLAVFVASAAAGHAASGSRGSDIAVQVSAAAGKAPPSITFTWVGDPAPAITYDGYELFRKAPEAGSWGAPLVTLPGDAVTWTDHDVRIGEAYEYQVVRSGTDRTAGAPLIFHGYGCITAGIEVPAVERRGTVVLLVDETKVGALRDELGRLEQDLVGDGWVVRRHDVSPSLKDWQVKEIIRADYQADPGNVRALFILGHIAVPYAGDINPDGHNDHHGAWAADVYYADMKVTWTDSTTDTRANDKQRFATTLNVPGDGRWDQSYVPPDGAAVLGVGRVDFSDLPAFQASGQDETSLLRSYLEKDHRYRHNISPFDTVPRRALLDDGYLPARNRPYGMALATSDALFGPGCFDVADWMAVLPSRSYLWAFGFAVGGPDGVVGVAQTGQLAHSDLRAPFALMMGSYSGDWNVRDNVLRAMLAQGSYCLGCDWGTAEQHYHPMALGASIGDCVRLAQNNRGLYPSPYPTEFAARALGSVHISHLGDPTLRLFPVPPPGEVRAERQGGTLRLTWRAALGEVQGYLVYRARSSSGPFTRVSAEPVRETSFRDADASAGPAVYLVRALRLESTGSGSYYNLSQGALARVP